MSVLSWFEHLLGISPTKPAAVNFAQVVANIETVADEAVAAFEAAEAANLLDAATSTKITALIPKIQAGLAQLQKSQLPTDAAAVLSDAQLVVPLLPPADQVAVSTALAVANVALASFMTPAAPAAPASA